MTDPSECSVRCELDIAPEDEPRAGLLAMVKRVRGRRVDPRLVVADAAFRLRLARRFPSIGGRPRRGPLGGAGA